MRGTKRGQLSDLYVAIEHYDQLLDALEVAARNVAGEDLQHITAVMGHEMRTRDALIKAAEEIERRMKEER